MDYDSNSNGSPGIRRRRRDVSTSPSKTPFEVVCRARNHSRESLKRQTLPHANATPENLPWNEYG